MQECNTNQLNIWRILRMAFAVYIALLLVLALFLAPWLVEEQNFGHNHPRSTAHHFHSIKAVLGSSVQAVTVTITVVWTVVWLLILLKPNQPVTLVFKGGNFARAPPQITI